MCTGKYICLFSLYKISRARDFSKTKMADAMLSKSEKATVKRPTISKMESKGKGKGETKKKPFVNKPSLSKDSEKVDCQMAATCSISGVAGSSEPSLTDIMGVLMTIQNEQNTKKLNMKNIESKVLEMYNDCDDAEYDEQDEFFYDVDDNNNDVESRQEIDENVEMENEPPNKRRKTYDNSNETVHVSLVL
jgi:hypothetical protein